jgi:hypothetical protein
VEKAALQEKYHLSAAGSRGGFEPVFVYGLAA